MNLIRRVVSWFRSPPPEIIPPVVVARVEAPEVMATVPRSGRRGPVKVVGVRALSARRM